MGWLWLGRRKPLLDADALHDARELRCRYGAGAEEWCELGLLAAAEPSKRRALKRIRTALAQVPLGSA